MSLPNASVYASPPKGQRSKGHNSMWALCLEERGVRPGEETESEDPGLIESPCSSSNCRYYLLVKLRRSVT